MRIYFCREGLNSIMALLQRELPDDQIFCCAPDKVVEVSREADVLIPTVSPITAEAIASPQLKIVQQYGAGLDTVDIPAATKRGVYVANVPTAGTGNAESVAELSIMFMLMLVRQYPQAHAALQQHKLGGPMGGTLKGRTAAIVGFGGIGQELATRLRAFEMKVLAVSKRGPKAGDVPVDFHGALDALHTVLRQADFVIVAPPLNDETRGLIGQAEYACMKPTAFIINVARGPVLDYAATLAALKEKRIAGAGLDVFWQEPFDPANEIFSYNVVATPHVGGATDLSLQGIAKKVADNINRVRRGEMPLNCANAADLGAKKG
ncbi:MAG: hydroxyacid dehydrogenase [Deltaproteobacteria bacterium]|nr:hydroxyacid dehydrogenase [Deltaproteobacteria bacterium]